jgi:hypothetical protein
MRGQAVGRVLMGLLLLMLVASLVLTSIPGGALR